MIVISVEHLSKSYRLGQIGTGRLVDDMQVWWAKRRGKPNPLLKIGQKDHGGRDGETIWALSDVNFEVRQGEVLGIIGRNGAGKSTVLKILTGVTAPTSGQMRAKGRVASLLEVGTGFHPELTGRENVFLNGAILGMKRVEIARKFDEIVAFSEVEQFIDTPVKRYSSGMYVRLAFAVAAHLDPEILLVDEVLAVGDGAFQQRCLGKIGEVARAGRTVLFVSHNMASIVNLCSGAILLDQGQVYSKGTAREIVDLYAQRAMPNASVELSERTDRRGSGAARLVSISVRAENGEAVLRCSDRLAVRVGYSSSAPLRHASMHIRIRSRSGASVYFLESGDAGGLPDTLPANGVIRCITGPANLMPGAYLVNLALFLNRELIDNVKDACVVNIEPEDYHGTGRLPDAREALCLVPQTWGLEQDASEDLDGTMQMRVYQ